MEPDAKLAELLKQREALKQKMKQELKDAQKHVEDAQRKRKEILENRSGFPKSASQPVKGKRTPAARSLSGLWCSVM